MKTYKKPVIVSEEVLEKTSLNCYDYIYYAFGYEGCAEYIVGRGKDNTTSCCELHS